MKTVAIVQARMGSMRFPGKVMKPILGTSLIEFLLHRLSQAKRIDGIVLATTKQKVDDVLTENVQSLGYDVLRGDETDVLDRYYQAAKIARADVIVRITGDCPLVDPELVDQVIDAFDSETSDYISNANPPTFADGLDVVAPLPVAPLSAWRECTEIGPQREHVTSIYSKVSPIDFALVTSSSRRDDPRECQTVDDQQIFKSLKAFSPTSIHAAISAGATCLTHGSLSRRSCLLRTKNQKGKRRSRDVYWPETMEVGKARYLQAENMLPSKRAEMFLPEYRLALPQQSLALAVSLGFGRK